MGKHWKNISIYGRGAGARYTHTVLQVKYCFKFLFLLIDDSSANQRTTPLLVMLSFTPPPNITHITEILTMNTAPAMGMNGARGAHAQKAETQR